MVLPKGPYSDDGIYRWSLNLAHENQSSVWWPKYIWTSPAQDMLKILHEKGNKIIFLTGGQGQGKTAALYALSTELYACVYTKWSNRNSQRQITDEEKNREIKILLIDLPDYGSNGRKEIRKSLDQIQQYWVDINYQKTLVITLQREQLVDHVFLGKGIHIQLEPLPMYGMVNAVRQCHPQYQKHTVHAFYRMAKLSGGNMRQFQDYTMRTLDAYPDAGWDEITPEMVDRVVGHDGTEPHPSKYLSRLFPREETRQAAFRVLEHLKNHGPSNQKHIALALNYSQKKVGNVVKTLLRYGYVVKRKGDRNENIISLP